jgi:hypothetical protein
MFSVNRRVGERILFDVTGGQPVHFELTLLKLPKTSNGQARLGIEAPPQVRVQLARAVSALPPPARREAVTLLPLDEQLRWCRPPRAGWQWTLWEAIRFDGDAHLPALRTTLFLAKQKERAYAACDLFVQGDWQEVVTLSAEYLHLVSHFADQPIEGVTRSTLQSRWVQRIARRDLRHVRAAALAQFGLQA